MEQTSQTEPTSPRPSAGDAPLLRLSGLSKSFGPVQALNEVDFEVRAGEVTALIGDNGAGKSVLIKCIAGIHSPDHGDILWEGTPVRLRTPRDSALLGIETVYQDLALCNNLDIVQNMFLGRERMRGIVMDEEAMETSAQETLSSLAVTTVRSIRQPVASLSGGQRQSVAIAKAVLWNSKLVIMDEPTAALGVAQTAMVLALVRRLADRGLAAMIVSHNMNDVFEVADRIAVLRLGHIVAQRPKSELDPQIAVDLMTTGSSDRVVGAGRPQPGGTA
jgi:ABC-type sugar transport system ATPase subunit